MKWLLIEFQTTQGFRVKGNYFRSISCCHSASRVRHFGTERDIRMPQRLCLNILLDLVECWIFSKNSNDYAAFDNGLRSYSPPPPRCSIPHSGAGPTLYRGFTITLRHTTWHSQHTDIRAPGGIRTRNPSRRAAAYPRLRPHGYWDLTQWYSVRLQRTWIVNYKSVECLSKYRVFTAFINNFRSRDHDDNFQTSCR